MIVIFVGDVVGARAADYLAERVPELRARHRADVVVVNAENSAENGLGAGARQVAKLLEAGVDVITGGNHSWDSEESVRTLDNPAVLRPENVPEGVPGRGRLVLELPAGSLTVLNLADECAMRGVAAVGGKCLPSFPCWLAAEKTGTVLVDYHGDHVLEKQIFAHAVDGTAAAVLGTHTHEPTLPMHVLPGGTALVTDVGMTGPTGGVQGFAPANLLNNLAHHGNPFAGPLPGPADGSITLGAVLLEIEGNKTVRLERLV